MPPAQKVPGAQSTQADGVLLSEAGIVPAAHWPAAVQLERLGPVVVVPVGHGVQPRSLRPVPSLLTKVPAGQVDQGTHAVAFEVFVKVPLGQPAQVRSSVALPADTMKRPGPHCVLGWQAAGLPDGE